jgi:hypothetical protein
MRGGYRPGAGRPKGAADKKKRKKRSDAKKVTKKQKSKKRPENKQEPELNERIKKLLESGTNAKAKAFRDLVNKLAMGQQLTASETKTMVMLEKELTILTEQESGVSNDEMGDMTPLEYMLKVINDPSADQERRDKLAIAAAPFFHDKPGAKGKKQEREERAKSAGKGKFKQGKSPLKLVKNNK